MTRTVSAEQRMVQRHYFWVDEPVYESPAVSLRTFSFTGLSSAILYLNVNLSDVNPDSVRVFFNSILLGQGMEIQGQYDVTDIVRSGDNEVRITYGVVIPSWPQGRFSIFLDVDALIAAPTIPEFPDWLFPVVVVLATIPIAYVGATAIADWARGR